MAQPPTPGCDIVWAAAQEGFDGNHEASRSGHWVFVLSLVIAVRGWELFLF
jgi:hypothetical protein